MNRSKRAVIRQLTKVGVTLVRVAPMILQCQRCGVEWQPGPLRLRPPHEYWRCLSGCNPPAHTF